MKTKEQQIVDLTYDTSEEAAIILHIEMWNDIFENQFTSKEESYVYKILDKHKIRVSQDCFLCEYYRDCFDCPLMQNHPYNNGCNSDYEHIPEIDPWQVYIRPFSKEEKSKATFDILTIFGNF